MAAPKMMRVRARLSGPYRRGGLDLSGGQPVEIAAEDLSKESLDALDADPRVEIEAVEPAKPATKSKRTGKTKAAKPRAAKPKAPNAKAVQDKSLDAVEPAGTGADTIAGTDGSTAETSTETTIDTGVTD